MRRHLIDRGHSESNTARARVYALLDRAYLLQDRHPKLRTLARRPRRASDTARLLQYLRIARGREA
ncbi:hypothetical protein SAMN05216257_101562 [Meinhardsimonia xiamenensis]|jgi:hypothetical protein|uniref:Transposase n=1 Tax=Meinhardsimonia xiamenensis TaxID=990712 RepID=A0A1G8Z5W5_9RHOB|nr:hypothetical protein [Meinhardsimonia xiamenensis]PRX37538.1 hypothetical protein LV81_01317 [Meinhardsimonia xiamenensis]SDK09620.1 hypothetical protein SAMN05216257_101562 [Meinhardsimonia xiamenensis]